MNKKFGAGVWGPCAILACIGLWPCSVVPFCVDPLKDKVHCCPNCSVVLAVNKYC